jgi:two-component system, OmpR family, phosphate regulon sensor histidine kinase PhoR
MNKKTFILSNALIFLFTFLLYFITTLSIHFTIRNDVYRDNDAFVNSATASLKTSSDSDAFIAKYTGVPGVRVTFFDLRGTTYKATQDTFSYYEEAYSYDQLNAKVDTTYFENGNGTPATYCYHVLYLQKSSSFLRLGNEVPSSYRTSFDFCLYGSIAIFLGDGVYFFYSYRKLSSSLLALKSQVKKLRDITNVERIVNYDDNLEFMSLMIRDARKELDAQLKEAKTNEQKMEFVLDSFSQALIVIDANDRIVMFNKKASEIFHLPKEEAAGHDMSLLQKGEKIEKNLSTVAKTQIPLVYFEAIDNHYYECDINPIDFAWAKNEERSGASLLMIDVTENFNSSKMKRDFFANASHELKSPLTSILGYQEMIHEGITSSPEEEKDAVAKTIKEAERMRQIIMDMLELSSLENEELRPIEQLNVAQELDNILQSLEIQLKAKAIQVHFEKKNLIIGINPDDFDKLFRNLLENAIRYNKDGGNIWIRMDEKAMKVAIQDNGIGIASDDQTRIFERFYRVDKARSQKNGGTGLGLAIVKYICNYYDYTIDVQSTLGVGSTFTLTLKK